MSRLVVEIKVGESLRIGDALLVLEKKSGQVARLRIDADPSIPVISPKTRRHQGDNPQRMSAASSIEDQHNG